MHDHSRCPSRATCAGSRCIRDRAALRVARLPALACLALALGGCSGVVAVLQSEVMTGAGIASFLLTGKGVADHALSAVSGRDCRIVSGLVRSDRGVCERPGSAPTRGDFRGLMALVRPSAPPADTIGLWSTPAGAAAAPVQAALHLRMSAGGFQGVGPLDAPSSARSPPRIEVDESRDPAPSPTRFSPSSSRLSLRLDDGAGVPL